jgi:hypothetical protein
VSGRFERKSKRRLPPITYCVVVEGIKTEANYFGDAKAEFDRLQRDLREAAKNSGNLNTRDCSLLIVVAGGRSFVNVVQKALEQVGLGHEKIWCVVDADFYVRLTGLQRQEADHEYKRALRAGIDIVFSRPCFEVWFRHHFNAETSAWVDGSTSKQRIAALWPAYNTKPDQHWDLLKDRCTQAFANAQQVRISHGCPPATVEDCDASSDVDWLLMDLFFGIRPNE